MLSVESLIIPTFSALLIPHSGKKEILKQFFLSPLLGLSLKNLEVFPTGSSRFFWSKEKFFSSLIRLSAVVAEKLSSRPALDVIIWLSFPLVQCRKSNKSLCVYGELLSFLIMFGSSTFNFLFCRHCRIFLFSSLPSTKFFFFTQKKWKKMKKVLKIKTVRFFFEERKSEERKVHELSHISQSIVHHKISTDRMRSLKFKNFPRRKINPLWTFLPIIDKEIVGKLFNVLTHKKLKRNEVKIIRMENIQRVHNLSYFPSAEKVAYEVTLYLHWTD